MFARADFGAPTTAIAGVTIQALQESSQISFQNDCVVAWHAPRADSPPWATRAKFINRQPSHCFPRAGTPSAKFHLSIENSDTCSRRNCRHHIRRNPVQSRPTCWNPSHPAQRLPDPCRAAGRARPPGRQVAVSLHLGTVAVRSITRHWPGQDSPKARRQVARPAGCRHRSDSVAESGEILMSYPFSA